MNKITIDKEFIRGRLKEAVQGAVYSQAAVIKPEDFTKRLMEVSTQQREKTIMALLGVDSTWGRCELYKTNQHVTQLQQWIMSEIGDKLEEFIKEEARKAFEKEQPAIRKGLKEAVARHTREMCSDFKIARVVEGMMQEYTQNLGKEVFAEIINDILPEGVSEPVQS